MLKRQMERDKKTIALLRDAAAFFARKNSNEREG